MNTFLKAVKSSLPVTFNFQVNEFSVEPPVHSDDEYEVMNQSHSSQTLSLVSPVEPTLSPIESNQHRPLSLDLNGRHTKSLSLPFATSPIKGPDESSSEEPSEVDSDEIDYSSEDDESMFMRSLPPDFFLNNLSGLKVDADNTDTQHCSSPDEEPAQELQSSERKPSKSSDLDLSAHKQTEAAEEQGGSDDDGLEEKQIKEVDDKEDEVHHERDQMEDETQR